VTKLSKNYYRALDEVSLFTHYFSFDSYCVRSLVALALRQARDRLSDEGVLVLGIRYSNISYSSAIYCCVRMTFLLGLTRVIRGTCVLPIGLNLVVYNRMRCRNTA